jgi:hypothetical protein
MKQLTALRFLGLAAALCLAACDKAPVVQQNRKLADFNIADLKGTWAWYGVENCWNNGNSISFDQSDSKVFHIHVRYYNATVFDVRNASIGRSFAGEFPVMIVRYVLQGRSYEEQYQPVDFDTLRVYKSLVNGEPQKLSSIDQPGRVLVRCKEKKAP